MLTTDAKTRKDTPMARGLLDYFPDACAAVAEVSRVGNDQHNPGQPMHWAKEKSTDHADCIVRHLVDRGGLDIDGLRHTAKIAWRALALLQTELEAQAKLEARVAEVADRAPGTCPDIDQEFSSNDEYARAFTAAARAIARGLDPLAPLTSITG